MWRICSVASLAAASVSLSLLTFSGWVEMKSKTEEKYHALIYFVVLVYAAARLILIGLLFAALRSMLVGVYMQAAWVDYIPRVGNRADSYQTDTKSSLVTHWATAAMHILSDTTAFHSHLVSRKHRPSKLCARLT